MLSSPRIHLPPKPCPCGRDKIRPWSQPRESTVAIVRPGSFPAPHSPLRPANAHPPCHTYACAQWGCEAALWFRTAPVDNYGVTFWYMSETSADVRVSNYCVVATVSIFLTTRYLTSDSLSVHILRSELKRTSGDNIAYRDNVMLTLNIFVQGPLCEITQLQS